MEFRNTITDDIPEVLRIYDSARRFMRSTGNLDQWINGYPCEEDIKIDIASGGGYVGMSENRLAAVFYLSFDGEPTYSYIDGAWPDDRPYGVIHRIAVADFIRRRGAAADCLSFSIEQCRLRGLSSLRIDTHRDNIPMRSFLEKNGFKYCGVIYLKTGAKRLAYSYMLN